MGELILLAASTLISEDLACVAAAGLIASGMATFWGATSACAIGIFGGDLMLYWAGRIFSSLVRRWIGNDRLEKAANWLRTNGPMVLLLSRFTPGLRLPTYVAAGLVKTNAWTFSLILMGAALIWTPAFIGLATWFGAKSGRALTMFAFVLVAARWIHSHLGSHRARRMALGWWKRKVRWEFWPSWAAYLPLIPYFLWLACKDRSFTVFTAANPGFPAGGFVGESKSQILDGFSERERIAEYQLIDTLPAMVDYPVVLKPDTGERGSGVAVIRSKAEFVDYLAAAKSPIIMQEYVPGVEFGIFYYRFPGEPQGHILSVTEKRFPVLIGDGRKTVEELILDDSRAICLASAYLTSCRRDPLSIPMMGDHIQLVELGSHCRGAIFLNAATIMTPALESAIDRMSRSRPGFYFGRYDVRASSVEALQSGDFRIIELNGVTSEATHIYDPAVSIREAYRVLFHQWRLAFKIGEQNAMRGAKVTPLGALLRLIACKPAKGSGMASSKDLRIPSPTW